MFGSCTVIWRCIQPGGLRWHFWWTTGRGLMSLCCHPQVICQLVELGPKLDTKNRSIGQKKRKLIAERVLVRKEKERNCMKRLGKILLLGIVLH